MGNVILSNFDNHFEAMKTIIFRPNDKKGEEAVLPTEEELKEWLYPISLGRSTNKLVITEDIVRVVKADAFVYKTVLETLPSIQKYNYRLKSPESMNQKLLRHPDSRFQSVFNDILSLRVFSDEYLSSCPKYLRLVDMRAGKKDDDGYRAQHFYYKPDNYHYIIEIQLWAGDDINFNLWSHSLTYKYTTDLNKMQYLRGLYDAGELQTYSDFEQEVCKIWN